jgi:hypothetical protein
VLSKTLRHLSCVTAKGGEEDGMDGPSRKTKRRGKKRRQTKAIAKDTAKETAHHLKLGVAPNVRVLWEVLLACLDHLHIDFADGHL